MKSFKDIHYQLFILVAGILLFVPFLGGVHLFDWDEINFAESAREMIVTGNYLDVQIDFKAFWEKPPLFIWLQVLSMKLFGINEFAARFPNAMVGVASLLVFFNLGKKLFNREFGLIWTLVYAGSVLPFLYFKSGIIDPLFNLFIFLSIYQFFRFIQAEQGKELKPIILSAVFNGLGILTKGPVAFLIFGLVAFSYMVLYKQFKKILRLKILLTYAVVVAFVGGFWFLLQIAFGNYSVIVDFVEYQIRLFQIKDAGHGGFPGYHVVVLLLGVFPASLFALHSMGRKAIGNDEQNDFRRWMLLTFWVVLILFTIVKTKIIHYSSMAYFPLGFLGALSVYRMIKGELRFSSGLKISLILISLLYAFIIASFRWIEHAKQEIINSEAIKDPFALGNLQAEVHWPIIIPIIALIYVFAISFFSLSKRKINIRLAGIFLATMLFMEVTMTLVVPRIEAYSQRAAIEFYESISDEDCYVETFGYKSYAKYFYTQKKPSQAGAHITLNWLLSGDADKKVYIVCKNTRRNQFAERYTNFTLLYEKNGFAFFMTEKSQK